MGRAGWGGGMGRGVRAGEHRAVQGALEAQARSLPPGEGEGCQGDFSEEGMSEQEDRRSVLDEEKEKGVPGWGGGGTTYAKARQ